MIDPRDKWLIKDWLRRKGYYVISSCDDYIDLVAIKDSEVYLIALAPRCDEEILGDISIRLSSFLYDRDADYKSNDIHVCIACVVGGIDEGRRKEVKLRCERG